VFSPCWARNSLLGPAGNSPSLRPEFPAGPDSLLGPLARPRWHWRESVPSREFRAQQGKNTNPPKSLSGTCNTASTSTLSLLSVSIERGSTSRVPTAHDCIIRTDHACMHAAGPCMGKSQACRRTIIRNFFRPFFLGKQSYYWRNRLPWSGSQIRSALNQRLERAVIYDYIHNPWVDICAKWRPYVTIGDDTPTINGLPTPSRGGGK
jgi:hypothetical protein